LNRSTSRGDSLGGTNASVHARLARARKPRSTTRAMVLETQKKSQVAEYSHRFSQCQLFAHIAAAATSNLFLPRQNRKLCIPNTRAKLYRVGLKERTLVQVRPTLILPLSDVAELHVSPLWRAKRQRSGRLRGGWLQ
jgi:hypothetical protein